MITRESVSWRRTTRLLWPVLGAMLAYTIAIVALDANGVDVALPIALPALLGTAISILLGFRTNSAYERWWEARKIWGGIVNDSRTLARQVLALPEGSVEARKLARSVVHRQIAWCHALRHALRGEDPLQDLDGLLPEDELAGLRTADHVPGVLLAAQSAELADAMRSGLVEPLMFLPIEGTLTRLCDHMGKCERIKSTVFPTHYRYFLSRIIWLFFVLLPPGLVGSVGWLTAPIALVVGLAFLLIERLGEALLNPFESHVTDTPMTAICRTIEINLRELLGETERPPKLEPVDGVLM